jgi:hypothetical protein
MAAAVHKLLHPHSHSHRANQDNKTAGADDQQQQQHAQPAAEPESQQQPEQQTAEQPDPQMERDRRDEKQALAQWDINQRPLNPDEIHENPENKALGHTSRVLRQEDFELIKTLGTGAPLCSPFIGTAELTIAPQGPLRACGSYG